MRWRPVPPSHRWRSAMRCRLPGEIPPWFYCGSQKGTQLMPYVSAPLLEEAIKNLTGKHPLAVLVVPAMVSNGVHVVGSADEGSPYGSAQELSILQTMFALPGGPSDRPYRAIWEEDPNN